MIMAMMVLGSPRVYGCQTREAQGVLSTLPSQYLDMCPGVMHSRMAEEGSRGLTSAKVSLAWLKVIHRQAAQSVLSFTCREVPCMGGSKDCLQACG
jgi:hypothetical protein